ncbi:hypothetical protein ANN_08962 [Periplaneta americana]|uniref:Uncharacterized protein n=1 Tax=Periplaneta americana TaxID=6978 RepID=A0ABQ8T3C6_PERAM|nr:hypothetical protein ANN_08962 [Periplaneta americana]
MPGNHSKNDPPYILKLDSMELLCSTYKDHLQIYTDGSLNPNNGTSGAGYYIQKYQESYFIPCSSSSSLDTELLAIDAALHQVPKANAWIFNKSGLSKSEWVTCLKMNANLAAVRGVPGRSLDGSRCRHGCPETETLAHVQAYSQTTKKGYIIDSTIRIETGSSQPEDVNKEKINIYLPTVDYFKAKYQLEDIEVIGLLIGARGVIPKFFESFRKTFELPQTLTADITSVLKRSCQILTSTEIYPAFVPIGLRENPGKNLNQVTCPDRELKPPGFPARRTNRYSTGVHNNGIRQTVTVNGECFYNMLLLRVFENKVLRKIFGAKQDEVTGEWRKLHNTELHALYSSPDIIRNLKSRRLRWAGHVARMGESRNAYGVLVGRPEGKRPLGRPRRRWEDNIKMDLREVGYDDRDWINLAQDRDR